jgi:hypothetical protein
MAGGEMFGFVLSMTMQALVNGHSKQHSRMAVVVYVTIAMIGTWLLVYVKEDLRKQAFEKEYGKAMPMVEEFNEMPMVEANKKGDIIYQL